MGKLRVAVEQYQESTKRKTGLDRLRDTLDPEDYDDLLELLRDRDVSVSAICTALQSIDVNVAKSTIGDWRRSL